MEGNFSGFQINEFHIVLWEFPITWTWIEDETFGDLGGLVRVFVVLEVQHYLVVSFLFASSISVPFSVTQAFPDLLSPQSHLKCPPVMWHLQNVGGGFRGLEYRVLRLKTARV